MSRLSHGSESTRPLPAELHDLDGNGIVCLRIDGPADTRGKAQAFFASEWDLDFTEARVRKRWFGHDLEYEAEQVADGIEEPYDGWPLREMKSGAAGAAPYWTLAEECYDR